MDYADLSGEIPLAEIVNALDDNNDGAADEAAWASVQASAAERIADAFGGTVPAEHARAADYALRIFLCEILIRRRGMSGERNPFTAQASALEKRLRALATGAEAVQGAGGGTEFTQPTRVAGYEGLMA